MKTLLKDSQRPAEVAGLRRQSPGCARWAFRFSLSQKSPAPLWQQARIQAIGFRPADLEREHWEKVRRSMLGG